MSYSNDLEVDRGIQDDFPTVHQKNDEGLQCVTSFGGERFPSINNPPTVNRICGFRTTTFWLALALALALIFGAVGVGVAGSRAGSRKAAPTAPESSVHTTIYPITTVTATDVPTPEPSISRLQITSDNNSTFFPSSDCVNMTSPYTAYAGNVQFDLRCASDYVGGDMVGIFVFTFQWCMEACADYNVRMKGQNLTCQGVSYNLDENSVRGSPLPLQNCWLKADGVKLTATTANLVSSAILATS